MGGFSYYGYIHDRSYFQFRLGSYDPLSCVNWWLVSKGKSASHAIAELHESFFHPKLLHQFNNIIHETLVQAFLDEGRSKYREWIECYQPLVEGTALANLSINIPKLFPIAYKASDSKTREVCEKLISIHGFLLKAAKSRATPLIQELISDISLRPLHGHSTSIMERLSSFTLSLLDPYNLSNSEYEPKDVEKHYQNMLNYLMNYLQMHILKNNSLHEEKPHMRMATELYKFLFALEAGNLIQSRDRHAPRAVRHLLANLAQVCPNMLVYLIKRGKVRFAAIRQRSFFYNVYYINYITKDAGLSVQKPRKNPNSYLHLFNFIKDNVFWRVSQVAESSPKDESPLYEAAVKTITNLFSLVSTKYKEWENRKIANYHEARFYGDSFNPILHYSEEKKSFWCNCSQKARSLLEVFEPKEFEGALYTFMNLVREENRRAPKVLEDLENSWKELNMFPDNVKRKIVGDITFTMNEFVKSMKEAGISVDVKKIESEFKSGNLLVLPETD